MLLLITAWIGVVSFFYLLCSFVVSLIASFSQIQSWILQFQLFFFFFLFLYPQRVNNIQLYQWLYTCYLRTELLLVTWKYDLRPSICLCPLIWARVTQTLLYPATSFISPGGKPRHSQASWEIYSLNCVLGLSQGLSLVGHARNSPWRKLGGILTSCLNHFNWLLVTKSPSQMSKLPRYL